MSTGWKQNEIVVIGAGLAGLFTALKLAPRPVTIVSAAPLGEGTASAWAQAGIAAALEPGDTPFAHALDTMQAGAGIVNPRIAQILASEAAARIEDLLSFGAPFDRTLEGDLLLSREAAHSARRIVRVKGDRAGWAIMRALIKAARATPSIQFIEGHIAKKFEVSGNRVQGVHLWSQTPAHVYLPASAIVLAAGGIGALYRTTTNPSGANGEALAMAAKAGAFLADPEFVQFHPTAIRCDLDPAPLATEALRGDGAFLINKNGERFMQAAHKEAELAPRDIVARAVFTQNTRGLEPALDCREAIGAAFPERYPSVYEKCMSQGIDPLKQPIPVAPAAHFHMGGVLTDAFGRTTLEGLWACGEVASTGAHGANRLASNSLLEAVVFAARIAEDLEGRFRIERRSAGAASKNAPLDTDFTTVLRKKHKLVVHDMRQLMDRRVGIVRKQAGLEKALKKLNDWAAEHTHNLTLHNMLTTARIITASALARKESRGSHFRSDYPEKDPNEAHRTRISLQQVNDLCDEKVPADD